VVLLCTTKTPRGGEPEARPHGLGGRAASAGFESLRSIQSNDCNISNRSFLRLRFFIFSGMV